MEPKCLLKYSQKLATGPVLSQMNPVHIFSPYFPKIRFNIILQSTRRSSKWPLPFRFTHQNLE
jgi:hypothetical protein